MVLFVFEFVACFVGWIPWRTVAFILSISVPVCMICWLLVGCARKRRNLQPTCKKFPRNLDVHHCPEPSIAFTATHPMQQLQAGPNFLGRVTQLQTSILERFKAPGCLVSLGAYAPDTKIIYHVDLPLGNSQPCVPIPKNFNWRIGSVTKTFIATLLLQCSKAYTDFSPQSTLDRWFPQFPHAKQITLIMLANMTSGIADYEQAPAFQKQFEANPYFEWTPTALLELGLSQKPHFAPGTAWSYCNTNYILLGLILVKHTKFRSLNALLAHYIYKPFGLKNTYLSEPSLDGIHDTSIREPALHGWSEAAVVDKPVDVTRWNPSWAWAAGSMVSNATDMHIWARVFGTGAAFRAMCPPLKGAQVLAPGIDPQLYAASAFIHPFDLTFYYGAGLVLDNECMYHNGSIPGYETVVAFYPRLNLSVVLVVNQTTLPSIHTERNAANTLFAELNNMIRPEYPLHSPPRPH